METGLSNLAFPRLNLSSMRSCDREEVDLEGKGQKAERNINNGLSLELRDTQYHKQQWIQCLCAICCVIVMILKITSSYIKKALCSFGEEIQFLNFNIYNIN